MLHTILAMLLASLFAPGPGGPAVPVEDAVKTRNSIASSHGQAVRLRVAGVVRVAMDHDTAMRTGLSSHNETSAGTVDLPRRDPLNKNLVSMVAERCLSLAEQGIVNGRDDPEPAPALPKPLYYCGGFSARFA